MHAPAITPAPALAPAPVLAGPARLRGLQRRHLSTALVAAAAAACGLLPAAAAAQRPDARPRAVTPRGALLPDEQAQVELFRRLSPSVVHITTLGLRRELFSRSVHQVPQGTGSGFVWDATGHIVTNFHVIKDASGATVTLADQSTHEATLVGAFPDRDLAVLKINAPTERLPPIPIGTSRDLQVGQRVYAIGNPFGLDQTLTTGIVSALNREIESFNGRTIRGAVQTDAAINPGNSGGPLLDSVGRLIGVNTQIASPSGASAGIGFAIPVDEVNRIVPRLIRDGRITRPSLGLGAGDARLNRALKLPDGVAVVQVDPNGPAARAGIQPFARNRDGSIVAGDVITAVNDDAISNFDDLLTALERRQPGDTVTLRLWRAGRQRQQALRLAEEE